ncbi:hypothetical protein B0F90DRAFT_1796452 [Multifurca ochricompacta]|uniref:Uncharacterized protein n=1 Tax=Multifurca ochricompacta TaxID=376703 RepID=A0AAD4LW54_9AGAM|nr:hypothetical protein B0F90DRAFT_1796452 [Multifurca ochricompacta]
MKVLAAAEFTLNVCLFLIFFQFLKNHFYMPQWGMVPMEHACYSSSAVTSLFHLRHLPAS